MTNPKSIALLAGARPNYMKVFPLLRVLDREPGRWRTVLIHTGQHYDALMNDVFFEDFGARKPDHCLGVGSGSHGAQTAKVMIALEALFQAERPDALVVVGDVNSTMAGALVAAKMGIPVAHLEAGLRSFDRTMPEEINRIVTDSVSDLLLTSCRDADENLKREGIPESRIRFVGNIMIDSLVHLLPKAGANDAAGRLGLKDREYCLVTLHRPSNVDDPERLALIVRQLAELAQTLPVVFPVHPRTRKSLQALPDNAGLIADHRLPDFAKATSGELITSGPGLHLLDPLGYLDFLSLQLRAAAVVTDSGGIQEETSFLGIPCLTVRPNTERPVTVTHGTNRLVDPAAESIGAVLPDHIARVRSRPRPAIEGWDGNAAGRVAGQLMDDR